MIKIVIGWREIVALPELGISEIKVKVDTGAYSSALHALNIEEFHQGGKSMVRFQVYPSQGDTQKIIIAQAELLEYRKVWSSNGHLQRRPVIESIVKLGQQHWPIEITLTNRSLMGFPMLLGRKAIRQRFLVDSRKSFLQGKTSGKNLL